MKEKRLITLILAVCLCLSLCVPALAAGTTLTVDIPEKLPAVGETFDVTVSIKGNPGLYAVQMSLLYDPSIVECTRARKGSIMSDMLSASNPDADCGELMGAKIAAASTDPAEGDGSIGRFVFKVLKDGDPQFKLTDVRLSEKNGTAIPYEMKDGHAAPEDQQDETEEKPEDEENPEEEEKLPTGGQQFSDVTESHWAFKNINRAANEGLIKGYEDGTFGPERNMSRAEFVTVLWRMNGSPAPKKEAKFADVSKDDWFAKQISWAAENGYVNGSGDNFNPNGVITREQVMSILFRYSGGQSGMETMFTETYDAQFTDSGSISEWAKPAVYWSIYQGIVGGMTETTIVPQGNATRAQISTIFLRYMDKIS